MRQFYIIFLFIVFAAQGAFAGSETIAIDLSSVKVEKVTNNTFKNIMVKGFSKISVKGFENNKKVGAPELPVKSWLLNGKPQQIKVSLDVKKQKVLTDVKPFPVQEQDCRCATQKVKKFQYNKNLYKNQNPYTLTYLGAFRGKHITRLDVNMAAYNSRKNEVSLNTQMEIKFNATEYSFEPGDYRDYLIVTSGNLKNGISEFVSWKKSQGYNVSVEEVNAPTHKALSEMIRKYYDNGTDFVILVGDENAIPMYEVDTSGSYTTPTDLKYYLMDGGYDYVPDMFYSRIVAKEPAQVTAQLNKSLEFEQKSSQDLSGLKRIIGIASNEGSSPSDEDYVRGIEKNFTSVLGVEATHFAQDDTVNSNPIMLNKTFDQGAFWLTYLGHGSGTAWASMDVWYRTGDVSNIKNQNVVKPIIIDVACMNGVIKSGYLGSKFLETSDTGAFGAAAYYGGTVNISWHPPAVMATGIASEHLSKKFKHLGEALLAGQLYLAEKWNDEGQVIDNFEWYHLQGDPGMNIEF